MKINLHKLGNKENHEVLLRFLNDKNSKSICLPNRILISIDNMGIFCNRLVKSTINGYVMLTFMDLTTTGIIGIQRLKNMVKVNIKVMEITKRSEF